MTRIAKKKFATVDVDVAVEKKKMKQRVHTPRSPGRELFLFLALVGWLPISTGVATAAMAENPVKTGSPSATASPKKLAPRPPSQVRAKDHPNDVGKQLDIAWALSPDDTSDIKTRKVQNYRIERSESSDKSFTVVGTVNAQIASHTDRDATPGVEYYYRVIAVGLDTDGKIESEAATTAVPVAGERQWFNSTLSWQAILLGLICGAVIYFVEAARRGRDLKVRKIAGLAAVDEAVGRATEMGRPILFVPGIMDISEIQTVAGLTILSHVAGLASQFEARLEVPTARSLVMTSARETVQAAYAANGRPDAYREDDIYYVSDEQFAYVASVTGTMVRERPAACFYLGQFFAESLLLAETGNAVGAIQIAGTAETSQLPFFVAACDYALIGEEFFAASAYLSGQPHQLGSLKGQDFGKVIVALLIVVGVFLQSMSVAVENFRKKVATPPIHAAEPISTTAVKYLRDHVLGRGGLFPPQPQEPQPARQDPNAAEEDET